MQSRLFRSARHAAALAVVHTDNSERTLESVRSKRPVSTASEMKFAPLSTYEDETVPEARSDAAVKEEEWDASPATQELDKGEQAPLCDTDSRKCVPADTKQHTDKGPILLEPCLRPAALRRVQLTGHLNALLQTLASGLRYLPAPRRALTDVEQLIYDVSQQCDMEPMEEHVSMLEDTIDLKQRGFTDMALSLDALSKNTNTYSWFDDIFRCKRFTFDNESHKYIDAARLFRWVVHATQGTSLQVQWDTFAKSLLVKGSDIMLIQSIGDVKGVGVYHTLQVDGFSDERTVNEADAPLRYPARKTVNYQLVGLMAGSGNDATAFVRMPDSRWWHCNDTDIQMLEKESDIDAKLNPKSNSGGDIAAKPTPTSPTLWAFVRSEMYAVPETARFVHELVRKVNNTDEAVLIIGYHREREDEFAPDALTKGANIFTLDKDENPAHPQAFRFNFRNITAASFDRVQAVLRPLFKEIVFEWSTFKFVREEDYAAVFHFFGRLLKEEGRLLIISACGGLIPAPDESHPLFRLASKLKQYWTEDEVAAYAAYRATMIREKKEKIMRAANFDPVTRQPVSPEAEFATATFVDTRGEAVSDYVDMLVEKQTRRFGYSSDTQKANFYGDIFVATRKSDF